MLKFILSKLLYLIPTVFGITLVAFGFIRLLPGDPVLLMAGERGVSPERYAEITAQLGYDKPIWQQYLHYLNQLAHGDLGNSLVTKKPVLTEFLTLFPATVELGLVAILIATLVGVPVGVLAAIRRGSWFDQISMTGALIGFSMPIFWWGLLLILLFSVQLGWTPVSGRIDVRYFVEPVTGFLTIDALLSDEQGAFRSALAHLVLPVIVLGTNPLAIIARMTRSAMLEVLGEDYIRTARAKGLPRWRVIALHAFRNALIPVVTVIGLQVGVLFTGAILTETIFSWPGVGKWLIEAINRRDYPVLQGGLLLLGVVVMLVNLLVDIAYGVINPRIRHAK